MRIFITLTLSALCSATWAVPTANFDSFLSALDTLPEQPMPASMPQGRLPTVYDSRLGLPTFIWASGDEAVPAVGALRPRALAEARARAYLARYARALGLDAAVLAAAQAHDVHLRPGGPSIARFAQHHAGHEVYNRRLNVLMDAAGRLVAISGYFAPAAGTAEFLLTADEAIHLAIAQFGTVPTSSLAVAEHRAGYDWYQIPALASADLVLTRGPRLKRIAYAHPHRLEAAYYVELFASAGTETPAWSFVISAVDGALLARKNLVEDAFTYRVYADPAGINQPWDSPLGNAWQPFPSDNPNFPVERVDAGSQLVTLSTSPLISTGDPWLPEGATETVGNNVDAYTDSALPDGHQPEVPGTAPVGSGADVRAQTTAPGVFDYPLVADMDPTSEEGRKAAAVTLFYVNNWLHDLYYDHGFDETAGVGQTSNYGRGGVENDAVKAEGQDWSGRNNANMATPADGSPARMQMYLFDGPDSLPSLILIGLTSAGDYDGTIDPLIIAHEHMHYVSNRLVGNASGLNNNQGRSMGEGWSDLASLFIAVRAEDRALPFNHRYQGTYSVGVYVDPNFYYSIRRQPYSTDFAKNSFTFRHIQDGEPAPTGAPTQGSGSGSAQVHDSGEIWANMMWECWAQLLNDPRHSFDQARDRMVNYTINGLKMTPPSPTFVEARDGVLAAALANDPEDFLACGRGFARRGNGLRAQAPQRGSTDHAGVIESFEPFLLQARSAPLATPRSGGGAGWPLGLSLLLLCLRRRHAH